jgi:hypothetical protein
MVPDPQPGSSPSRPPASSPAASRPGLDSVPPGAVVELLRSLERMEADLAEMRAEVERMRRHLVSTPTQPAQPRPPR